MSLYMQDVKLILLGLFSLVFNFFMLELTLVLLLDYLSQVLGIQQPSHHQCYKHWILLSLLQDKGFLF